MNGLNYFHLKKLEKIEQIKLEGRKREETVKVRAEINGIENRKIMQEVK